ncbi:MAG: outer membrane protein assembly factor BamB family protein [Gemmatimonadaceae bacterium]
MQFSLWLRRLSVAVAVPLGVSLWSCRDSTGPGSGRVHERWYQSQSGYARARPAVSGNVVYFGDGFGDVIARDVRTGIQVWITKAGQDPVDGANILVRAGVVVAPLQTHTVGLDAATGRGLWSFKAPDDTVGVPPGYVAAPGSVWLASIDADDQTVYIPAWGASVSAVDLHTGNVRWIWHPGRIEGDTATSGIFRSGAMGVRVSGDTIFATMWHFVTANGALSEGWLVAIDRRGGKELWRVRLSYQGSGTYIWTAPVVYGNLVIVHTLSARTYAINRTTQTVVWEFTVPSANPLSTIAGVGLYGDVVYVDGGDEQLHALRARDGSVIWNAPFPAQTDTDLLVTERRVIFTNGMELMFLDRETGRMVARTIQPRTYDGLFSSAAVFSNGLVFITMAGAAWCIDEP